MLKRFIVGGVLLALVLSCNNSGKPEKPDNLISKKDMINILIDARLIGSSSGINKRKMREAGIDVDKYVLEKYGIDSLQFAQSNEYYAYYIDDYEEIYEKIVDSLEGLKNTLKEFEEQEEAEKKRLDSLNVIKEHDSVMKLFSKDSLKKQLLDKKELEEGILIDPVSEIDQK
ncbi:DUF4296 domain-containing protein [Gaetbulibacter saemankumensis]|uniref:DUF4296 domain-containing protein n=1 Tax=Gaetbulibacter saemankumensis TaxID=311208 RepID=UPI00048425E2|nr:DUF4296 domain-containing protein [Gaetbulibacter saemankumensis]